MLGDFTPRQRAGGEPLRGESRERGRLTLHGEEMRAADVDRVDAAVRLHDPFPQPEQLIFPGERQRPEQREIDDAEHRAGSTDPQREGSEGGHGHAAVAADRAESGAEVLEERVHGVSTGGGDSHSSTSRAARST